MSENRVENAGCFPKRTVDILIPSFNGWHLLNVCLNSLRTQTYRDFQIVVVDNGSSDRTGEFVRDNFPEVRLIELDKNYGFCGAINRAIEQTCSPYIALLNNDTEAEPKWLEELLRGFDRSKNVASCASKILQFNRRYLLDTAGDVMTIAGFGYKRGWNQPDGQEFDQENYVFSACAGAAIYKRELFEAVGPLDEDFFAFGEDLDIGFRAQLAGYKCLYVPKARVYHRVRATAGMNSHLSIRLHHRNLVAIVLKNFPLSLLVLYSPHIVMYWIVAFLSNVYRGRGKPFCIGLFEGVMTSGKALKKRKQVQKLRRVPISCLRDIMDANWFRSMTGLSTTMRRFIRRTSTTA